MTWLLNRRFCLVGEDAGHIFSGQNAAALQDGDQCGKGDGDTLRTEWRIRGDDARRRWVEVIERSLLGGHATANRTRPGSIPVRAA